MRLNNNTIIIYQSPCGASPLVHFLLGMSASAVRTVLQLLLLLLYSDRAHRAGLILCALRAL